VGAGACCGYTALLEQAAADCSAYRVLESLPGEEHWQALPRKNCQASEKHSKARHCCYCKDSLICSSIQIWSCSMEEERKLKLH